MAKIMLAPLLTHGLIALLAFGLVGAYGTHSYYRTPAPALTGPTLPAGSYSKVEVHRKTVTWLEAVQMCRRQNLSLLCYSQARHVSQVAAELTFFAFPRMWILNRNCSEPISEPNLSIDLKNLNLSRTQVSYVAHHTFHKESDTEKLPFICFVKVPSTAAPSSLMHAPEVVNGSLEIIENEISSTVETPKKALKEVKRAGRPYLNGRPYVISCTRYRDEASKLCSQCETCKRCKKLESLDKCVPCTDSDSDCADVYGKEQCQNGGQLACFNPNSEEDVRLVYDDIKNLPQYTNHVTFWTTVETCSEEQGNAVYFDVLNKQGTFVSKLGIKLPAICEVISSPESTTTDTTTSTTTSTTKTTTITTITTTTTTTTTMSTTTVIQDQCCPKTVSRGITWEKQCEKSGLVFKNCPDGAAGLARWYCDMSKGEWIPSSPLLEDCKSDFVSELDKVNRSNVAEALNELSKYTPSFGGDVVEIGKVLNEVLEYVQQFIESAENPTDRQNLAVNVTESVISLGDSLLNDKTVWKDLSEQRRKKVATDLLKNGEDTAFQCAYNLDKNQSKSFEKKAFTLQVLKNWRGSFHEGLVLPLHSSQSTASSSKFVLPAGFEKSLNSSSENFTAVVFFEYKDLADILLAPSLQEVANSTSSTVNSHVVSVSINNNKVRVSLEEPAVFVMRHVERNAKSPACMFWNTVSLSWDSEGCKVVSTNKSFTQCACDHLTNFAVLMDIQGATDTISEADQKLLQTITQIGCFISIIFLSATIVVTTVYRTLWGMRNSVHRNLCICLMVAEVLFVAAGSRTETKVFCAVIAGLLHYFFTAAFCWMLLEAVLIYLLLYKVFSPKKSYSKQFYAVGYGVPMVIVGISAAVRPSGYGTEVACWLSREHGFRWSFVGPVSVILLLNFAALVYALYVAKKSSQRMNQRSGPSISRAWILGGLTLVPLLGSTWIIGFILLKNESVLIYIFTILNSLQGLAIFIVLCLLNQSSRKCLLKSFGKYTSIIPSSSMNTSTNRSMTNSDPQRKSQSKDRKTSSTQSTNTSCATPDPLLSAQRNNPKNNPWKFPPLFLRSISGKFNVASGDHTDSGDISYSASVSDNPSVMLKQTQRL